MSARPDDGYQLVVAHDGPDTVEGRIVGDEEQTTFRMRCVDGHPSSTTTVEPDGGDASGSGD